MIQSLLKKICNFFYRIERYSRSAATRQIVSSRRNYFAESWLEETSNCWRLARLGFYLELPSAPKCVIFLRMTERVDWIVQSVSRGFFDWKRTCTGVYTLRLTTKMCKSTGSVFENMKRYAPTRDCNIIMHMRVRVFNEHWRLYSVYRCCHRSSRGPPTRSCRSYTIIVRMTWR